MKPFQLRSHDYFVLNRHIYIYHKAEIAENLICHFLAHGIKIILVPIDLFSPKYANKDRYGGYAWGA